MKVLAFVLIKLLLYDLGGCLDGTFVAQQWTAQETTQTAVDLKRQQWLPECVPLIDRFVIPYRINTAAAEVNGHWQSTLLFCL